MAKHLDDTIAAKVILNIRARPEMLLSGTGLLNCIECQEPCSFSHLVLSCVESAQEAKRLLDKSRTVIGTQIWGAMTRTDIILALLGSTKELSRDVVMEVLRGTAIFMRNTLGLD
jgi:hypothetical protein